MFSPVHLEYFYIYIVNFRRMASGAFCDEEDVLEIYKFSSSSDSDDDPDEWSCTSWTRVRVSFIENQN